MGNTTLTQNNIITKEENNLTEDAWLYYDSIPEGENRIDVPVTLVMDKTKYTQFMQLVLNNDADLFRDIISSIANDRIEKWVAGEFGIEEPQVLASIMAVVMKKQLGKAQTQKKDQEA